MYLGFVGERGYAYMPADLLLAYVGHEGISFPSPHFLDFCICGTPIWQFSGHADAKIDMQRRGWLNQNCVGLGASNDSTFSMDKQ